MSFEKFEGMSSQLVPKVSIRSNGNIGFSSGAVNKFDLTKSKFCRLYFDRDGYRIGFEFINNEEQGITARVFRRELDCFIRAKPFLEYYSINFAETKVFMASRDTSTGYLVIDLKNPLYIRGARKKKV